MVKCPFCNNDIGDSYDTKFCSQCGRQITSEVKVSECDFSDDEAALINKIAFNLERTIPANKAAKTGNVIRTVGDVENIPPDFEGSIVSLGSISFAETKTHTLKVGYKGEGLCREAAFKKAAIIRRVGGENRIMIRTDIGTYWIGPSDLDPTKMRTFSRTPIVLLCHANSVFVMCDIGRDYIMDGDGPLDMDCITRVDPMKHYLLSGDRAYFRVD